MSVVRQKHFDYLQPILVEMIQNNMLVSHDCDRTKRNDNDVPNTLEQTWRDVTLRGIDFERVTVITTTWPSDKFQDIKVRLQYPGRELRDGRKNRCIYWELHVTNWPSTFQMYRIGESNLFMSVVEPPIGIKKMFEYEKGGNHYPKRPYNRRERVPEPEVEPEEPPSFVVTL
jgi:hypothetical protein